MKKLLALTMIAVFALCLCVPAMAAGTYTVTVINGMDGSVAETFEVADGEDLVFTISCAAPCDMGPTADGEEGAGVETTSGTIAYSNITTGGPNAYPTAETVTISGITEDCTVTVTPNPDEAEAEFPTITEGEGDSSASGEASGEASDEASGEASGEAVSVEDAYVEYLHEWLLAEDEVNDTMTSDIVENEFMPLLQAHDYTTFPAEMLWGDMLETGNPMTFEEFAAQYTADSGEGDTSEEAYKEYLKAFVAAVPANEGVEDEFYAVIDAGDYYSFPMEIGFSGYWGEIPMTLEEFQAAGGVYVLPDMSGVVAD